MFSSVNPMYQKKAGIVRFRLKQFRDITIFSVSNFVIIYKIVLNYLSYVI